MLIKRLFVISLFVSTFLVTGCGGGGSSSPSENDDSLPSELLSGALQKGPFLVGTDISISELNQDLTSTGRVFSSETLDNSGSYETTVSLTSPYAELTATGYYFNEVTGAISNAPISLGVIFDIRESSQINVNILTEVSRKRIRALVGTGENFSTARELAENEIKSLFSFGAAPVLNRFDQLDLAQTGSANGFLLLASIVLQNTNVSANEFSNFINGLSQDLSVDGVVGSSVASSISTSEASVDIDAIRQNLVQRYRNLGASVVLPDLEGFINRAPEANAGQNQSGFVGELVTLNGSASTDIDNDALDYSWRFLSTPVGSQSELMNATTLYPSFTPDIGGTYSMGLVVSDGELSSELSTTLFSTENRNPIASAGFDQTIAIGNPISLDATGSYDPDGDELTYFWSLSTQPQESIEGATLSIDEPPLPSDLNYLYYDVIVEDVNGGSDTDRVAIRVEPAFTDNGDGTISDSLGNMWEKEDDGVVYTVDPDIIWMYQSCLNKNRFGHNDWRLPTLNELKTLVDFDATSPKINLSYFPNAKSANYGSGEQETHTATPSIDFSSGEEVNAGDVYVRCIR